MLDEFRQGDPSCCVHVQMIPVLNELLIDVVRLHTLRAEPTRQELDEVMLELGREIGDVLPCALTDDEHLAEVGLGLGMTFKSVLIPALFLTDLAIPAQALKTLRLHLVGEVLRRTN